MKVRDAMAETISIITPEDTNRRAAEVMKQEDTGFVPVMKGDVLDTAASKMVEREVRRLAVVEDEHLVGVLSHGNLLQATRGEGPAEEATIGVTKGA
jgi:CBS domain-containing protein